MKKREEIPVLVTEIKAEVSKLERLAQRLSSQTGRLGSDEILESAALRLHNFYTGCERIFKLIASEVNGALPDTQDWHKRLLTQVALEVEQVRPAVVSEETRRELEELLGFRHVVRNVYGYELEPGRVESLLQMTVSLFPRLRQEIGGFLEFLMDLYREI